MSLLFYVFHLLILWCNGLKIFENSLNATDYKLFYHRTADFGPQPGTYNVSGRLQLMDPLIACGIEEYIHYIDDEYHEYIEYREYNQIYNNNIVLILRGNCTFSKKVYNAQLLGAIGVIVGDYNTSQDEWIVMSRDLSKKKEEIYIPSVFVPHNTYQWISKLILSYSSEYSPLNMDADEHDTEATLNMNVIEAPGVYAILDSDGEYVAPNSTFWLAAFGIVIIIIPTLWCFIVCVALLRRKIVNYVQKSRRRKHLTQIPIILYKVCEVNSKATDDTVPLSLSVGEYINIEHEVKEDMNTLSNNEDGMKHEVSGGVLSTNLKSMSRFLLDQFRSKKEYSQPHNDSCAICLDDFRLNEELRLLPCNHGFHKHCVDPWLTKSSELCPMCKQSIFVSSEDEKVSNGCLPSISKICCIRNGDRNRNRNRREQNDDDNVSIVSDDVNDDGIIVLPASQDELVPIDSDSDHSPLDGNAEEE